MCRLRTQEKDADRIESPGYGLDNEYAWMEEDVTLQLDTDLDLIATDLDRIRDIIGRYGKLPVEVSSVGNHDDLYDKGLTSHASVNVMIGLEDEFDIEFPDRLLQKSTFASIAAIADALAGLV